MKKTVMGAKRDHQVFGQDRFRRTHYLANHTISVLPGFIQSLPIAHLVNGFPFVLEYF